VDLPTYTSIWRIEKRLYKLYDFRLPMPVPVGQIAVFAAITVPYVVLLTILGLPFNHTLFWLYVLPPGVLTWLATRPVLESKRLPELIISQVRYLGEPATWCRMTALTEKDDVVVVGRIWHQAQASGRAEEDPQAQADRRRSKGRRTADRQSARSGGERVAPPTPVRAPRPAAAPDVAPTPRRAAAGVRARARSQAEYRARPGFIEVSHDGREEYPTAARGLAYEPTAAPDPAIRPAAAVWEHAATRETPGVVAPARPGLAPQPGPAGQPGSAPQPGAADRGRPAGHAGPAANGPSPALPPRPTVGTWPGTGSAVKPSATSPAASTAPSSTTPSSTAPSSTAPPSTAPSSTAPSPAASTAPPSTAPSRAPSANVPPPSPPPSSVPPRSAPPASAAPPSAPPASAAPPSAPPASAAPPSAPPASAAPPSAARPSPPPLSVPPSSVPPRGAPPASVAPPSAARPSPPPPSAAPPSAPPPSVAPPSEPPASVAPPSVPTASVPAARAPEVPAQDPPIVVVTGGGAGGRPPRAIERVLNGPADHRGGNWREHVRVVPGGHGPGRPDLAKRDQARALLPIEGPRMVVVLGCTVGAGQTVTTLMIADLLASLRGEAVAALDLNPGRPSLTDLARGTPAATVPALLAGAGPAVTSARGRGRLDVIAHGDYPDGQVLADAEYRKLFDILGERYPLTLADPGASAVARVLAATDQLVLVAPASPEAARAVAMTQEWLEAHGYGDLSTGSITVLNGVSKRSMVHVEQAELVVRGRCRAIVRVPWDDHLAAPEAEQGIRDLRSALDPRARQALGPHSELGQLRAPVRAAYTALAGVLVDTLAADRQRRRVFR
jgi:MinD-like ATPase involved in chromosome partitioning or flagellar assembly